MHRDDLRRLMLAGTVSFPPTFPRVGELHLCDVDDETGVFGSSRMTFLTVTERPNPRTSLVRRLPVASVYAVFLPNSPAHVTWEDGRWLLGKEVESGLRLHLADRGAIWGIAYVAEATETLLDVSAGMTAAESAEYYPPLPCDRTRNHYDPHGQPADVGPSSAVPSGDPADVVEASVGPRSCDLVLASPQTRFSCDRFSCDIAAPSGGAGNQPPATRLSCDSADRTSPGRHPFRGEAGRA